jgi:hypothetical protein
MGRLDPILKNPTCFFNFAFVKRPEPAKIHSGKINQQKWGTKNKEEL